MRRVVVIALLTLLTLVGCKHQGNSGVDTSPDTDSKVACSQLRDLPEHTHVRNAQSVAKTFQKTGPPVMWQAGDDAVKSKSVTHIRKVLTEACDETLGAGNW